jgi:hypothetical protein
MSDQNKFPKVQAYTDDPKPDNVEPSIDPGLKSEPENIEDLKKVVNQAKTKKALTALMVVMGVILFAGLLFAAFSFTSQEVAQGLTKEPENVELTESYTTGSLSLTSATFNPVEETLGYTLTGTLPNTCLDTYEVIEDINNQVVSLTVEASWSDNLYNCEQLETKFEITKTTNNIGDLFVDTSQELEQKIELSLNFDQSPFTTEIPSLQVTTETQAIAITQTCGLQVLFDQGDTSNQEKVIRFVQLNENSFTLTNALRDIEKGTISCLPVSSTEESKEQAESKLNQETDTKSEDKQDDDVETFDKRDFCNDLKLDLQNCFALTQANVEEAEGQKTYSFVAGSQIITITNPVFESLQLTSVSPQVEATVETTPSQSLEGFILPKQESYTNQYYPDLNIQYDETFSFSTETQNSNYENLLSRQIYLLKNQTLLTFNITPKYPTDCFSDRNDSIRLAQLSNGMARYRYTTYDQIQFYMKDKGELAKNCSHLEIVLGSNLESSSYNEVFEGLVESYVTIDVSGNFDADTLLEMDKIVERSSFGTVN